MAKRKNKKIIVKRNRLKGNTATVNRKYKDTVFRMLFSDRKNLLSLYNAINGTSYTDAAQLEIVTLENEHAFERLILHFQRISENGGLEVLVYLNKTENTHTEFYRIL